MQSRTVLGITSLDYVIFKGRTTRDDYRPVLHLGHADYKTYINIYRMFQTSAASSRGHLRLNVSRTTVRVATVSKLRASFM